MTGLRSGTSSAKRSGVGGRGADKQGARRTGWLRSTNRCPCGAMTRKRAQAESSLPKGSARAHWLPAVAPMKGVVRNAPRHSL